MKKLIIITLAVVLMSSCSMMSKTQHICEYGVNQEYQIKKDSITLKTFIYVDYRVDTVLIDRIHPTHFDSVVKIRKGQANLIINIINKL